MEDLEVSKTMEGGGASPLDGTENQRRLKRLLLYSGGDVIFRTIRGLIGHR